MKKFGFLILIMILFIFYPLFATSVSSARALKAAESQLTLIDKSHRAQISNSFLLQNDTDTLAYVFYLIPVGYIVVSADDALPPVIAYSTTSTFEDPNTDANLLKKIIEQDLNLRVQNIASIPSNLISKHNEAWSNLLKNHQSKRFQQWPPEGTTTSGGWLKTQWTQGSPYNMFCPMDIVTGSRSQAGCPAVAMGQIVNYYATINGTTFSDADDYHHNYSGNNYWIDDDASTYSFPSFPELNSHLETMVHHYRYQEEVTETDKAALVFACGIAAHQVYASAGSGTFSVNQALQAYQKFKFQMAQLLTEDIPELYNNISRNIISAKPVHLAIESQDQSTGHNVVIDGYNTNQFYHLNFGWGSAYDGWYLLPDELPFGLTMIEGAIVNIEPIQYISVTPSTLIIPSPVQMNQPYTITIQNINPVMSVTIEDYYFNTSFADLDWEVQHDSFPKTLTFGENTVVTFIPHSTGNNTGNLYQTSFRIILDQTAIDVPIQYQSPVHNSDDYQTPSHSTLSMSNYPSPMSSSTFISFELLKQAQVTLSIFNTKGVLIKVMINGIQTKGYHLLNWDGTNNHSHKVASGVYFYRLSAGSDFITKKIILIK